MLLFPTRHDFFRLKSDWTLHGDDVWRGELFDLSFGPFPGYKERWKAHEELVAGNKLRFILPAGTVLNFGSYEIRKNTDNHIIRTDIFVSPDKRFMPLSRGGTTKGGVKFSATLKEIRAADLEYDEDIKR